MNCLKFLANILRGTTRGSVEFESVIIRTFKKAGLRVRCGQPIDETLPSGTKSIIDFIP